MGEWEEMREREGKRREKKRRKVKKCWHCHRRRRRLFRHRGSSLHPQIFRSTRSAVARRKIRRKGEDGNERSDVGPRPL